MTISLLESKVLRVVGKSSDNALCGPVSEAIVSSSGGGISALCEVVSVTNLFVVDERTQNGCSQEGEVALVHVLVRPAISVDTISYCSDLNSKLVVAQSLEDFKLAHDLSFRQATRFQLAQSSSPSSSSSIRCKIQLSKLDGDTP